jgi:hypothetical protein
MATPIAPVGIVVSGAACVGGAGVVATAPAAAGASPLPHAMANAIIINLTRGTFTRVASRRFFSIYFGAPRKSSVAHDLMLFMPHVQCLFLAYF